MDILPIRRVGRIGSCMSRKLTLRRYSAVRHFADRAENVRHHGEGEKDECAGDEDFCFFEDDAREGFSGRGDYREGCGEESSRIVRGGREGYLVVWWWGIVSRIIGGGIGGYGGGYGESGFVGRGNEAFGRRDGIVEVAVGGESDLWVGGGFVDL